MTDRDRLIEWLDSTGVDWMSGDKHHYELNPQDVVLVPERNTKVDGYVFFYTSFDFNEDGSLKGVMIAE